MTLICHHSYTCEMYMIGVYCTSPSENIIRKRALFKKNNKRLWIPEISRGLWLPHPCVHLPTTVSHPWQIRPLSWPEGCWWPQRSASRRGPCLKRRNGMILSRKHNPSPEIIHALSWWKKRLAWSLPLWSDCPWTHKEVGSAHNNKKRSQVWFKPVDDMARRQAWTNQAFAQLILLRHQLSEINLLRNNGDFSSIFSAVFFCLVASRIWASYPL